MEEVMGDEGVEEEKEERKHNSRTTAAQQQQEYEGLLAHQSSI